MRTRKPPIRKKPASHSLTSLFSSVTHNSSSSNATVTQESVVRGRPRPSKESPSRASEIGPLVRVTKQEEEVKIPQVSTAMATVTERPNVFAFMEDDNSDAESHHSKDASSSDSESEHEHPSPIPSIKKPAPLEQPVLSKQSTPPMPAIPAWDQTHPRSMSFHSDSGISVRSISPEQDSPVALAKQLAHAPFSARTRQRKREDSLSSVGSSAAPPPAKSHKFHGPPELYYTKTRRQKALPPPSIAESPRTPSFPPTPVQEQSLVPRRKSHAPVRIHHKASKSGYDLLASTVSTTAGEKLTPLYRRFETLTNRVILALQEEISIMEADLSELDRCVSEAEGRNRTRRPPPPLLWQRGELCALLAAKMEQYHRIISSYSSISTLPSASTDSVKEFELFLSKHDTPFAPSETAFLDHVSDLAAVTRPALPTEVSHGPITGVTTRFDKDPAVVGAAVLMTIVAFKLVPKFLGRVVLGACVVAAMVGAGWLPSPRVSDGSNGSNEGWGKRAAVYIGAVMFLAMAVG